MKKTLKFMKEHKQFTFFGILAVLIILAAVFAPVLTGGVDPLKGSLTEALEAPSKEHISERTKWAVIFMHVLFTEHVLP